MRLLDSRFKYRNAASTDIRDTFKRFGFRPTTDAERAARNKQVDAAKPIATVTPIKKRVRK